jgi:hypothetical protein
MYAIKRQGYVIPEDVRAAVVHDVLRHTELKSYEG